MGGGEVIKKGWLIKSPPLDSGGMKAWRKRFFCLRSSKVLEYYKSVDGDLKGVVNLEDCKAVHADLSHKKYKHVFDIETRDRTYYFVASSAEDMKNWVDTICHVCSFSLQSTTTVIGESSPVIGASQTMPGKMPSGQPLITSPSSMGGGVSFNERFKPAQNGATAESLYSLATESGAEVKRQLAGGSEVLSGVPLMEALASKGMGNISQRSATMDPGGPTLLYPMSGLPEYSFFSPRPGKVSDTQGIYSLAQNTQGKDRAATLMPGARLEESVTQYGSHRQLQASASLSGGHRDSPGVVGPSPSSSAGPTVGSTLAAVGRTDTVVPSLGGPANRAQQLENGYMAPRKIARPPAYDYPPFGPPRPAEPVVSSGSTPTRQPHSALLKPDERDVTSSVPPTSSPRNVAGRPPTYINMKNLDDNLPPLIDRSTKPTPPTIDRTLKPSGYSPPKNTPPKYEGEDSDDDSDSSESSPEQTKKTSIDSSFSVADLPKPTSRTTQYTQVEIVKASSRPKLSPDEEVDDISKRAPIPVPRVPKPRSRVNYSDIDLSATAARGESRTVSRSPTLRTAEQEKLKEKETEGYINVNREGEIDEDTDPDYYTHMRNLEGDDVDRPSLAVLKELIPPRS